MEFFTKANAPEAVEKIYEMEEEIFEVKKTSKKKISSKNLRSKRRKANAKEKNCRRKLGTRFEDNPYRGKPRDYIHDYHLYERHGKFDKLEHDRKKMEREYDYFEDEKECNNAEDFISEVIYETGDLTLAECIEKSEWGLFLFKIINKYPRDKVIEVVKMLDETEV